MLSNRRALLLALFAGTPVSAQKRGREAAIERALSEYAHALNGGRLLTKDELELGRIVGSHGGWGSALEHSELTRNGAAILGFLAGYAAARGDERNA